MLLCTHACNYRCSNGTGRLLDLRPDRILVRHQPDLACSQPCLGRASLTVRSCLGRHLGTPGLVWPGLCPTVGTTTTREAKRPNPPRRPPPPSPLRHFPSPPLLFHIPLRLCCSCSRAPPDLKSPLGFVLCSPNLSR
jgi:hypothetical protein